MTKINVLPTLQRCAFMNLGTTCQMGLSIPEVAVAKQGLPNHEMIG